MLLQQVDVLGYQPSSAAQRLRHSRAGAVGIELNAVGESPADIAHPFLVELSLAGVVAVLLDPEPVLQHVALGFADGQAAPQGRLRFGGNISKTAEFVGMERSALHRKIKSLGL